ncbi:MAG: peptide ABC transporter substrate-binding protein [Planctomycetota bacterium]|nr:MAG: peptide ABC transporter substrate-binding protein [Planctomycetota bacterium]
MHRLLSLIFACMLPVIWAADAFSTEALPPDWRQEFRPTDDSWRQLDQHLRFNNGTEPATLDPQIMTGVPEGRIALALFSGLVSLHPRTLQPVPDLAEHWSISEDGKVYTFTLRQGLRWSDGVKIDSATIRDSWRRLLDPALASEYSYQFFAVAGAQAYFRREIPFSQVGVATPDAHTVVVTLERPTPWFLELCAFATLKPVPLHVIAERGQRWTRPENIVTSGPFTLSEWHPRRHLRMQRNPKYWDADQVILERITAFPYDDLNTALQVYRSGGMEWMPGVPVNQVEELRSHPDYYAMPYLGIYFYRFNVTRPPLDNPLVRRALTKAINRSVITESITRAGEKPVSYWCPPIGAYQPRGGLEYDRDAARALLAEAGYPGGRGFPVLEILFNTSESHKAIAENIAHQWRQVLGINATARNREWQTYLADLRNLDYQVARSAWIGDYYDPNTFYDCFVSGGGNNRTGWSNAEYDALLAKSQETLEPEQRQAIFDRMEEILLREEAVIAPIYHYVYQGMLHETVMGFEHNPRDYHPFQYLWLQP